MNEPWQPPPSYPYQPPFGPPAPPSRPVPQQGYGPARGEPAPSYRVPVARRSKLPYAIGVVLVVVGIIGAIASGVGGFATATSDVSGTAFGPGDTTTVALQGGQDKIIYVSVNGAADFHCHMDGDSARIRLTRYPGDLDVNQWRALFTIGADDTGDHAVTCTGPADARFTVGGDASAAIGVGVVGAFLGAFVGFAGAVVLLVTFLRRQRPVAMYWTSPPNPNQLR